MAAAVTDRPSSQHLTTFWLVAVEGGLFHSSHERKFLGFLLFQVGDFDDWLSGWSLFLPLCHTCHIQARCC